MNISILLDCLVDANLPEVEVVAIVNAYELLATKMPFLLNQNRADVEALVRLHKGNEPFCNQAVVEAKQYKGVVPVSLSPDLLERKLGFAKKFGRVDAASERLAELVYVTAVRNGAEAVSIAMKLRDFFLHEAGLNGPNAKEALASYNRLSESFVERAAKAQKTMADKQSKVGALNKDKTA